MKVYVPRDAAALALGADEVAVAIAAEANRLGLDITLIRNGSRGMVWLEPLVEVERDGIRHSFGPALPSDATAILAGTSSKALGPTDQIDWLKRQTRLTFARVGVIDPLSLDDYKAHGGLVGLTRALEMTSPQIVTEVTACAAVAVRAFPRASSGKQWPRRKPIRNTSSATPMKAIAAPLPTAC